MSRSLQSLIQSGTKLWLDSIDLDLARTNRAFGATGATSNPIIVADLLKSGRYDAEITGLTRGGMSDDAIAWEVTDRMVKRVQDLFLPVWETTRGNDGYVSFELDPLLEDAQLGPPLPVRIERYIELGKKWAAGHSNRMIKIPATPAGLGAIEELVAAGLTLNVTLIFSSRQYREARDAAWRGAQRRGDLSHFKSVYSIFVSRIDVYTEKHVAGLSPAAQGQVGIVNAKRIWQENRDFWNAHPTPLQQEIVFASTGVKKATEAPWKYVAALAGSDIQTNPPATNDAVAKGDVSFNRQVDQMPSSEVLAEIDREVDFAKLEAVLMDEGLQKFSDPQKALLNLIRDKRSRLAA